MTKIALPKLTLILLLSTNLGGCGFRTPEFQAFYEDKGQFPKLMNQVAMNVKCELRAGLLKALDQHHTSGDLDWLGTWAAKVTMRMVADEKFSFTPGVSIISPMHNATTNFVGEAIPSANLPAAAAAVATSQTYSFLSTAQNFTLGLGGNLSSDATRTSTITFYLDFSKDLLADKDKIEKTRLAGYKCPHSDGGILIEGSLGLDEFFTPFSEMYATGAVDKEIIHANKRQAPFDASSHEIQFILTTGGNITPAWKLVRVASNQTGNLFNVSRARTNDLLVTMGPYSDLRKSGSALENTHLSNQIGQAVGTNVESQQQ